MTLVLKEIYSVPSVTLTWQVLIWENVYEIIISKAYCIYYVPETNVSIATFFHFNPKLWKEKWGIQYKRKVYRGWEWNLWKIPYILFTSIQYINTTERIRICKQLYKWMSRTISSHHWNPVPYIWDCFGWHRQQLRVDVVFNLSLPFVHSYYSYSIMLLLQLTSWGFALPQSAFKDN